MSARCMGLRLRLVPLGSQRRSSPLVWSLLGRCHGARGSQRYTSMLQLCSMPDQRAISRPWSQVRVLTSSTGCSCSAAVAAARLAEVTIIGINPDADECQPDEPEPDPEPKQEQERVTPQPTGTPPDTGTEPDPDPDDSEDPDPDPEPDAGDGSGEVPRRPCQPPAQPAGFTDVTPGDTHSDCIEAIYAAGITNGCDTNPLRYCGDDSITRAEMASFLARALKLRPAVWSAMLAARAEGVGSSLTSVLLFKNDETLEVFDVPKDQGWRMACCVPMGYPLGTWATASRLPAHEVSYRNTWGTPLGAEINEPLWP